MLVTRQPTGHHPDGDNVDQAPNPGHDPSGDQSVATNDQDEPAGLQQRLRAAATLLPPTLGGAPSQPLEVGRATRVVQPAQRAALTVRDRGCVFPGCDRPLAWCEAHHLQHWLHGGPTNLANLALLCRAHHRAVHEGGWQLARGPDGRFTATPPHRRNRAA
ncbi:MAG TPA: HNH endonuclease signature motif containing protein [Actinomycetes bacterium]